jgi:glycine/D-amino acid oxidase-like deaminating enzyme
MISNLWSATAAQAPATSPLSSDAEADLVIIGGGFTGASAALEAARQGARVTLLEGESLGHGGSGRNVGLVNAGLWLPPDDVVAAMGKDPADRLMSALAAGPAKVWEMIAREGIDCEATPKGTLHLAHSAKGFEGLRARHVQGRARGWPIALLDAAETARRTGSQAFHGALFDPRAGTIQPLSYALGLAHAAIRAGARLHDRTRVSRVTRQGEAWVVEANGHKVRGQKLLLATNAYFDGIDMGFAPEIIAVSYFQLATAPLPDRLRAQILAGEEGCWDTAMVMSSFRVDKAGRMILGGIGNLEGPGQSTHAAWARRKLAQVWPELAGMAFEHAWRGRIAMTSDHIPKVVSFGPGAAAVFGYSGRGICPGTVFGTALAEALLQDRPEALPLTPVVTHKERMTGAQEAWYEAGAMLTHAVSAR